MGICFNIIASNIANKNKVLKAVVVVIPYLGVFFDELMQKYAKFYIHPVDIPVISLFISGTFDKLDLLAYALGFVLAIATAVLIKKKIN